MGMAILCAPSTRSIDCVLPWAVVPYMVNNTTNLLSGVQRNGAGSSVLLPRGEPETRACTDVSPVGRPYKMRVVRPTPRGRAINHHWTWPWWPGGPVGGGWRVCWVCVSAGTLLFCTLDACGYQVAEVGRAVVSGESAERRLAGYHARNGIGRIAAFPGF